MIDQETREKLEPLVRVNQLIVAGLMASVVFLTIMLVVVFSTQRGDKIDPDDVPVVAYAAAGFALLACVTRIVIGPIVAKATERNSRPAANGFMSKIDDPTLKKFAAGWQTSNIVRNALTEGAALVNAVAYMVHGDLISLGVVGFLLAWMALGFPTAGRLEEHIESRLQAVE